MSKNGKCGTVTLSVVFGPSENGELDGSIVIADQVKFIRAELAKAEGWQP